MAEPRYRIRGHMIGGMIGLTVSNYLYQWLERGLWDVAMERSLFQVVALASVWLGIAISNRVQEDDNG
jgi:uncharacterized membrane protein YqgA involved in biofilm formation